MWLNMSDDVRKAVLFSQQEAAQLGRHIVDTEHLLLGVLRLQDGSIEIVLKRFNASSADVRAAVERMAARGHDKPGLDMTLAPRGKRAIDLAYDEARDARSANISAGHLFLGLLKEDQGLAHQVLTGLKIDLAIARIVITGK